MTRFKILSFAVAGMLVLNSIFGLTIAMNHFHIQDLEQNVFAGEVQGTSSVPIFDPNYVMSDSTFSSTRAFPTEQSVQNYLDAVNSPLRNYSESGRRASYWIFASSRGTTSSKWGIVPQINPGVMMAYLEKEQSLLSLSNYDTQGDPQNRIRSAMGYGCPDTSVCDSQYYGLANQLNWAAYQLQFNFDRSGTYSPLVSPYHINKTITTLDEYNVFLSNKATAAQYRYTPHVYWGNYNLWKIIVANGWGVSTQTHSTREIDRVNLANKDIQVDVSNQPFVSEAQARPLLENNYTLGSSSENIKNLQRYLRQEGYFMTRQVTGLYGTITRDAHFAWRRQEGILENIGNLTGRCRELIYQDWTIGQEGGDVVELQQCLRELGSFNWPTNSGYFGPVTREALDAALNALGDNQGGDKGNQGKSGQEGNDTCENLKNQQWSIGERSQRVVNLQACMRDRKFFNWPYGNTGYFGPVTQESLNNWRAANGGNNGGQNDKTPAPEQPSEPANRCEELRDRQWSIGTRSGEVVELQACMRDRKFFNWPYGNTGYFGSVTQESLSRWRGEQTPNVACTQLKSSAWVQGERSDRVQQLQACMRDAGTFNWPYGNTGYFGPVTREALIAWRGYF